MSTPGNQPANPTSPAAAPAVVTSPAVGVNSGGAKLTTPPDPKKLGTGSQADTPEAVPQANPN